MIRIPVDMFIPSDVEAIAKAYHNKNKDLFIVGGSVRDFIQGKIPHDYDLVTNATPEQSKEILKDFHVSDEQGKKFGVLRVYTANEPLGYEVAVYRSDISSGRDNKGTDKKVDFGQHIGIQEDAKRRDFSINSLYYDIKSKEIIDLVGGVEDIKNNIIRAVGNPAERFIEDRLRILRAGRFCARINGKIHEQTSQAIKTDNRLRGISEKDDVSQERIHEEWNKTIEHSLKDKSIMQRYIDLLTEYDMWIQMFPGLKINTNINIEFISNPIIFVDLFSNNILKDKKKLLNELKFTDKLINQMIFLQEYNENIDLAYRLAKLKERFHIDNQLILDFVQHKNLDKKFAEAFIKYCDDGFSIDGLDLMEQGFKGAEIEKEKTRLEIEIFVNKYYENF